MQQPKHDTKPTRIRSSAAQMRAASARWRYVPPTALTQPTVRLELTCEQLRGEYAYCLYCGHRYASAEELDEHCPGIDEEAHE